MPLQIIEPGTEKVQAEQNYHHNADIFKVDGAGAADHAHNAFGQFGGGHAQNFRADDVKNSGGDCEKEHQQKGEFVLRHIFCQTLDGAFGVLGLDAGIHVLDGLSASPHRTVACCHGRSCVAHDNSSFVSWEDAIS